MSSAAVGPWVKAVRVQDTGNTYYVTLEHVKRVNEANATEQTRPTYEVVVVDASQARAWHGSFTYQDIHNAVLQEHMADLRPLEVDSGLANCFNSGQIAFQWSGVDRSLLRVEAMYRRLALAPVSIRLPPEGGMQAQHGRSFNELNAGVLNLLLKQNSQLQAQTALQATQLQALLNHVQKVHDSYSDAVASIAANLVCEHVHLSPSTTRQQEAAAATAGASPAAAGNKRPRLGTAEVASPAAATGQQIHTASPAAAAVTLGSPAVVTLRAPQQQGSDLACRQHQQSQRPPAGATSGHAAANLISGSSRQLDRTPSKLKSRQLSSEEKLKQRIVSMQRKLQLEWEGWVQQLLQAEDVTESRAVISNSRLPQQQQQQQRVGQPSRLHSGLLQGNNSPQQTQEFASQHLLPNNQVEAGLASVAASQQLQHAGGDAGLVPEQYTQQQAALGDTVPDDDGDAEEEPAVVVHKARRRARAVSGALAGLRRR